jgi:hypothetical protein
MSRDRTKEREERGTPRMGGASEIKGRATRLTFFIAGLLLSLVPQSTSITWERTASHLLALIDPESGERKPQRGENNNDRVPPYSGLSAPEKPSP